MKIFCSSKKQAKYISTSVRSLLLVNVSDIDIKKETTTRAWIYQQSYCSHYVYCGYAIEKKLAKEISHKNYMYLDPPCYQVRGSPNA